MLLLRDRHFFVGRLPHILFERNPMRAPRLSTHAKINSFPELTTSRQHNAILAFSTVPNIKLILIDPKTCPRLLVMLRDLSECSVKQRMVKFAWCHLGFVPRVVPDPSGLHSLFVIVVVGVVFIVLESAIPTQEPTASPPPLFINPDPN